MGVIYLLGSVVAIYLFVRKREWKKSAYVLGAASLIAFVIWIIRFLNPQEELIFLNRSEKTGQEQRIELEADMEGEKRNITLELQPQDYSLQESEQLCEQLISELEVLALGNNESLMNIVEDMSFVDRVDNYPFVLSWNTDQPKVLSETGKIGEKIPEEGVIVKITVCITGSNGFEMYHTFFGKVCPSKTKTATLERLESTLIEQEENSRNNAVYLLPASFEGRNVHFKKREGQKDAAIFFLGVTAAIFMVVGLQQETQKAEEMKRQALLKEYPEVISKMAMLIGTGMTITGAFKRIAMEYGKQKRKQKKILYEELLITCREMDTGISEKTAYQNLSNRCQLTSITRFTALLIQYTKSGATGLVAALKEETEKALKEKNERARKLGEEAGTKLLLPMVLMLIVVMIMIMIPAFTSFQF